ncbi:MAG: hypothetical protein C0600_16145, partial [Ignavibacteria bacterium]
MSMNAAPLILSLDAGGSNFVFSALKEAIPVVSPVRREVDTRDLHQCLEDIVAGFSHMGELCEEKPRAISFAFPGPANYSEGVVGPLANIPACASPVAIGAFLEERFQLPVYINNDGDLFAYGEGRAGFLPELNARLAQSGEHRRLRNLVGLTLGTGLGCGVYLNGTLLQGDNDAAAEIWGSADPTGSGLPVEEIISIRGLRRLFAAEAGLQEDEAPAPVEIYRLLDGDDIAGKQAAAAAFRTFYSTLTEVIRSCITLFDGVVILGGGIAGSAQRFLPAVVASLNEETLLPDGRHVHRVESRV